MNPTENPTAKVTTNRSGRVMVAKPGRAIQTVGKVYEKPSYLRMAGMDKWVAVNRAGAQTTHRLKAEAVKHLTIGWL